MEIKIRNFNLAKYMQEGGVAPTDPNAAPAAPEQAPAPQEAAAQDPQTQLIMACQQALESQDCQLAMQVCAALMQMIGGDATSKGPAAPEGQQPVFKKGGRLSYWTNK